MEEILIVFLLIVGALGMILSGAWLLFETFVLFRLRMTDSLNSNLDIIKIARPKKQETQTAESIHQSEKGEISVMEHFLSSIANIQLKKSFLHRLIYGKPELAFEIAVPSDGDQISFYLSVPSKLRELVEKQIHSFYPGAFIEKIDDYTIFRPKGYTVGSYLKLKKNFAYPIRTYSRMESDPLRSITNALSKLESEEEGAAIQLIIKKSSSQNKKGKEIAQQMQQGKRLDQASGEGAMFGIAKDIGKGMVDVVSTKNENSQNNNSDRPVNLTPEENDIIKRIESKSNKARFEVNIRLLASAQTKERAETILAQMENAFSQFEDNNLNKFVVHRDSSKNARKLSFNYIFRSFNRQNSVVLDTEELASIFHFPISTTETPKINWLKSKVAHPPSNIPKEGLLLGYSDFRGTKTDIRLSRNDRRRHLYVIGQTGVGKSGFIEEMAKQDAQNGDGMCVIDPHGDLVDHIMECIPKERAEDIIYFNPADIDRPFGFNMLEYDYSKPEQRTFVINEMLSIFDKLYDLKTTGGPMFEQYMRNAMLLVLDSPETGSTLMEIPRIFRDPQFRKRKLELCKDMTVVDFWKKEAEKAGGEASLENITPYINSKLVPFISNDMMRPIIAQQKSTLNFRDIMDNKKILLINLSKGKLGEINSSLLGMVIVGKLLMAALSRTDIQEDERSDFYLYIDEFQNVTTDSISQILSEARKYRLCMTIAHQFIGQLSENISKAVFGNVGSLCSMRVGAEDAEFLQKQFLPIFDSNDLINIDNFNCVTKLLINNESSNAFNMKTYPPAKGSVELREAYKELSRYKYGRSREVVEAEIKLRYSAVAEALGGEMDVDE